MNENSVIESTLLDASEIHVKKEWYFQDDDAIWNAMVLIREYNKPLRGRSEVLVVDSKNKTVYLAFKSDGSYSIPGGAWEPDENRIQSSVREAQEEARLNVTDVIYSNSYVELDSKPRQWMMEKIRKENWWYGRYSEVYIGEYAGKFTGHINEVDKDDMIKIGKFYKIKEVYDKLLPYHRKAIDDYMLKKESGLLESSLPLPDNGRKIQVGDISFVYKNTYHPIYWVGDEPYRPRVETLVIRNGKDVFLRMYDTCEENSLYRYRLPGGSLDNDSTKEQQAENETNEEALLSISEIHNTGLSYYHYYKDGKLLKGGDICIKYKGTISDIFIAKYKSKVDKSTIEKHDLDNDMATNGKFYPIIKVCQLLRPEHIEAIMNSGLVDDNVKGSVRLILRGDKKTKIPEAPVKESNDIVTEGSIPIPIMKINEPYIEEKANKLKDKNISYSKSFNDVKNIADNLSKKDLNNICDGDFKNSPYVIYREVLLINKEPAAFIDVYNLFEPDTTVDGCIVVACKSKYRGMGLTRKLVNRMIHDKNFKWNHLIWEASKSNKASIALAKQLKFKETSRNNSDIEFSIFRESYIEVFDYATKQRLNVTESVIPEGSYDTIVFDFGDVLDKRDKNYMYSYYDKNIDQNYITMDEFKGIIKGYFKFAHNKYGSFKTGKNIDDLYKRTLSEKQRAYYDDALKCIENMGSIYDYAIPMLQSLRDKGYKLYYLTNKSKWNWENHGAKEKLKPLMNYFRTGIVSCDVGIEKPDIRIYKLLIKKTGLNPETTLFFDDKVVNTMAAQKVGMTGVVFTEDIVQDIMNLPPVNDTIIESTNLSLWGNPVPKNVTLYHASPVQGIKYIEPRQTVAYKDLGPVVFSSRYKSFAACFGTYWDDTTMKQGTDPDDLEKASMWIIDKAYDWSKPCSMYILENDGSFKELVGHPHEYISPNKIKVKKEIKFNSYYAMVKAYDIEVFDYATKQRLNVTESMITEMTTTSSVDDNHTKGESMNLSYFKKIKISKSIIDKMKKMIKSLSHIRLDNTEGYIYTDKNNPVAVIVVETKENGEKWIQALEVFGEYKNHGLSKQLLDVAVNELSATELSVNKKNDVAYSLYKKYGFKTKSETDTMYMMTLESNVTEAKSIGANTTGMKRSELPDEMFGIPSQRKYELDTEKHVRSAIKLFNWVDPKYEKELATNIIKRMKYFNITDVNVGPKNRFGKYYKGGNKK